MSGVDKRKRVSVEQDRQILADKLLDLKHMTITADFIESVIKYNCKELKIPVTLNHDQFDKISKFLSIKDIILNENRNHVALAV